MRRNTLIAVAVLGLALISRVELFAQDFDFPILVSDGLNSQELAIGVDPNGSSGYDPGLDLFAPPPPPPGAFDARLRILGEDYLKDVRDNAISEKEFFMLYAPQTGRSLTLYWDSALADSLGSFWMTDNINGTFFSLNMATADSLSISNYPVLAAGLKILLTPNPPLPIFPASGERSPFPGTWQLDQNFPNPFNSSTHIAYFVPQRGWVEISIFNVTGQRVKTLVSAVHAPGYYSLAWQGTDETGAAMASGTYFLVLTSTGQRQIRNMSLVK